MGKRHLITGTYSLLSKDCLRRVKELVADANIVELGILPSSAPFTTEDIKETLLKIFRNHMRREFSRGLIVINDMNHLDSINGKSLSSDFMEAFKTNTERVAKEILDFEASSYFCDEVGASEMELWALINSPGEFSSSLSEVKLVDKTLTWWDFTEVERATWSMCPDCMPRGEDSMRKDCLMCEGTGIDTSAPRYDGPSIAVLIGRKEAK